MKFSIVFAACLVIFAIQGSVLGSPHDAEERLVIDFKQVVKKLADTITNAIVKSVQQLEKLLQKYKEEAQEIFELIVQSIEKQSGQVITNVKDLIEEAKQLGIDVKECVGDKIEQIEQIPQKVSNTGRDCVKETVDEAKNIVDDTVLLLNDFKKMITEFEGKWNKCKTDACKIKLIVEATETTIFVREGISNQVNKAVELIQSLDDRLAVCLDNTLKLAVDEANRISEEMTVCINNKIPKA